VSMATQLYADMVAYVEASGWRLMEEGSGWWLEPQGGEASIGEAVEIQLSADGIDTRVRP